MTDSAVLSALDYYARIGASLFPIRRGAKVPTGIVGSWKTDHSRDPAQWAAWNSQNPGCNFGLVASASRLIIVDVDVSEVGRETAWKLWTDWCAANQVPVPAVSCQSARGGWHLYFRLPDGVDPDTLTQRALIGPPAGFKKAVVDTRVEGFTVAAGSYYDGTAKGEQSGHYVLMTDQPPSIAPDALIRHCTRTAAPVASAAALGTRDAGDVAAMVRWMASKDAFADYESWLGAGMALRTEFGDNPGLDLWRLTHDATVTAEVEAAKWASFSTDADSRSVTLNSLMAKAHQAGWHGTIRKSTSAMFDGVAAIAAAAGASLSSGAMPMVGWQKEFTDQFEPVLQEFINLTADAPSRPASPEFPTLPDSVSGHGLYATMQSAIARIIAMADLGGKAWKFNRVLEPLAVLKHIHKETFDSVVRRIQHTGVAVNPNKIDQRAIAIERDVSLKFRDLGAWVCDMKGKPEVDNPDNIIVLLGVCGKRVRYNAWLEKHEISPEHVDQWTQIDDGAIEDLMTRAKESGTRFCPGKDFTWDTVRSLARRNTVDPMVDRLKSLADGWDRTPRLATWLSRACGTPADLYHQAVSRNIIGGLVHRIRNPGCKHDTVPIFFGYQGSGKSTAAAIFADMGMSSLSEIALGRGRNFTDTIQLGDEAKELILSLSGVCVAEIGEMSARSSANANHIKAMVSRQVDRGRTAYSRTVAERPRRNIFWGTVNDGEPLTDPTGNRRFLPVRIDAEIDLKWLHANVAQIIGEAAYRHAHGDEFIIPRSIWGIAAEHQEAARSASDLEVQMHAWFGETSFTKVAYITADDLILACTEAKLRAAPAQRSIIMRHLGFRQEKPYLNGKRSSVWVRGPASMPPADIVSKAVRYGVGSGVDGRVKIVIGQGT